MSTGTAGRASRSIAEWAHAAVDWCFSKLAWLPVTLVLVLNGAAVALGLIAGFAAVGDRPLFVTLAILATVLAGGFGVLIERERRHADAVRAREGASVQLAVTDAVIPVLGYVGRMASEPSNRRAVPFQKTCGHILQSMAVLFPDIKDVRMVIYRVEVAGARTRLVVEDSAGRRRDKPQDFVSGDGGRGDAAIAWLRGGAAKFVADTNLEEDPAWKGSGRGYRTFIAAPILIQDAAFGMITVDAPVPGDLDETDIPLVEVLAGILAIAFQLKSR